MDLKGLDMQNPYYEGINTGKYGPLKDGSSLGFCPGEEQCEFLWELLS